MAEVMTVVKRPEPPDGIQHVEWMPLNEEYMAKKGMAMFREWVAAGMPRKDQ